MTLKDIGYTIVAHVIDGWDGDAVENYLHEKLIELTEPNQGGIELKPCPFCGSKVELHCDANGYIEEDGPIESAVPWWVACYNNDCPCMPQSGDQNKEGMATRQQAVDGWNRRI